MASYQSTILNAFREVEDALSDLATLSSQSEAVSRALLSARDTAALANERYQKGLSSYLDVVDAQRIALQAERQEAQLRGQRAISTKKVVPSTLGEGESARFFRPLRNPIHLLLRKIFQRRFNTDLRVRFSAARAKSAMAA